MDKLRVFIDSDVLLAASASGSEHGASLVVLRLGEITLLDLRVSQQVMTEVERNLQNKLPAALPTFQFLCQRCLTVVDSPMADNLTPYQGQADPRDLSILVAAIHEECEWLLTYNTRHFNPTNNTIRISQPGAFVKDVRQRLTELE